MLTRTIRAIWCEPAAPGATGPARRDLLVAALVMVIAPIETALRSDLVWPAPSMAVVVAGAYLLPFRRIHPLVTTAAVIGIASAVQLIAVVRDVRWEGLGVAIVFLLLPYSLGRWASGRQALGGAAVFAVPLALTTIGGGAASDVLGGAAVLLLAGAIGAGVRFRAISRREQLDNVRARERAELARDLHDTVAHHVTAIVVQAQAGRTLLRAGSPPGGARADVDPVDADRVDATPAAAIPVDAVTLDDVLAAIEDQAARSLDEMRSIVGALRADERTVLAPQRGVRDIERFASPDVPAITIEMSGALADLRPSVDAALYRLAGEAITNARRHATGATRIIVRLDATDDAVRLTVDDDGRPADPRLRDGYGLAGMAERVDLLGGTFRAGPRPGGGWSVSAELPRAGSTP